MYNLVSDLEQKLNYIEKFHFMVSQIYTGSTVGMNLITYKLLFMKNHSNSQQNIYQDIYFKKTVEELKDITSKFKLTLNDFSKLENNIYDETYRANIDKIFKTNLCETIFDENPCISEVKIYYKNGFWTIFPLYVSGFAKIDYYIEKIDNLPKLESFINSEIFRDILLSTSYTQKVMTLLSNYSKDQFLRKIDTQGNYLLIVTV